MEDSELPTYDMVITAAQNRVMGCSDDRFEPVFDTSKIPSAPSLLTENETTASNLNNFDSDCDTPKIPSAPLLPTENETITNNNFDKFEPDCETLKIPSAPLLSTENETIGVNFTNVKPNCVSSNTSLISPFQNRPNISMPSSAALTEDRIREVCYTYANNSHHGTKFIKNMIMTDILNTYTLNYKLESVGEKRETISGCTPYFGQHIDGPDVGPELNLWEIYVPEATEFKNEKIQLEMPHTAYVKHCRSCTGDHKVSCNPCYGNGSFDCFQCDGNGRGSDGYRCQKCGGSGKRECVLCLSTGRVQCKSCEGHGKLKLYKLLIVTRIIHTDEFLSNTMNLPKECVLSLSGKVIFSEQRNKVFPLTNAPDRLMCQASNDLIQKHQTIFPNETMVLQRHTLRAIPVTRVRYSCKNTDGEFYIYGFENKVHFDKYPQKDGPCKVM